MFPKIVLDLERSRMYIFSMADLTNRVVHFEINAENPARAAKFYSQVFDWNIQKWEGSAIEYYMVVTGADKVVGAINGGITSRESKVVPEDTQPINGFTCLIEVEDVESVVTKVIQAGGKITKEPYDLPQVGRLAYAMDQEGNHFGVIKSIPSATS